MKDTALSHFPNFARPFGATDGELAAELRNCSVARPAPSPVGELLSRHWGAVFSFATLCTCGPEHAGMLATAAFTRACGESLRRSASETAWRPHLLATVRRIAEEWDDDKRRVMLHPRLRTVPGTPDGAATRLGPAPHRRLMDQAFERLPERARCILWHVEAEAEELAVPAMLLGLDLEEAAVKLERARSLLRDACLRAHRDTAPREECRRYSRLLDVSLRRGDAEFDPDLRDHMTCCRHCRDAAEQLDHSEGRLGALLADVVLVWEPRSYLDSRPARRLEPDAPAHEPGPAGHEGTIRVVRDDADDEHIGAHAPFTPPYAPEAQGPALPAATLPTPFVPSALPAPAALPSTPVPGVPALRAVPPLPTLPTLPPTVPAPPSGPRHAVRRPRRGVFGTASNGTPRRLSCHARLAVAIAVASGCVLVPLTAFTVTGDGGGRDPGTPAAGPGPSAQLPDISGAGAGGLVSGPLEGRLRNAADGLCVEVDDVDPAPGSRAVLASCTSSERQQWVYEEDGSLRSLAGRDLCLGTHPGAPAELGTCEDDDDDRRERVRYDFTVQGTLIPRGAGALALTSASARQGADLVLQKRVADDGTQRWVVDGSVEGVQVESVSRMEDESDPAGPAPASPARTAPPPAVPRPAPARPNPPPSGMPRCITYFCSPDGSWYRRRYDGPRPDYGGGPGSQDGFRYRYGYGYPGGFGGGQ